MTNGTILFIVITLVTVSDIAIALFFRSRADRMDSGEITAEAGSADGMRKTATMLLVAAPLLWLIATLFSFGVIPSGLTPAQF